MYTEAEIKTEEELVVIIRAVIAREGSISGHDLVHTVCLENSLFNQLSGRILKSLPLTTEEYPLYSVNRGIYTYVESAPEKVLENTEV